MNLYNIDKLKKITIRFLKEYNLYADAKKSRDFYKNFENLESDLYKLVEFKPSDILKMLVDLNLLYRDNENYTVKFYNFIVKNYITKETKQELKQMMIKVLNDNDMEEDYFNHLIKCYTSAREDTLYYATTPWRKHMKKYNLRNMDDMINNIIPNFYFWHTFNLEDIILPKEVKDKLRCIENDWRKMIFNFNYIK